ncbi:hypothetical protein PHLGIDRAFT_121198 [Phlebiopsis gigantea 11061_1 CR5-6]|uniref:Major facilitator superfamily (MFS) profile domain-containing protein n=1 Tax=Phlebiopsis gigantea (strain 11061_1 CR5-6) TaxID=745531 RepID=A0A0C3RTB8_PHLG1|nr:hypothetical protein PHLGIDRAFT_121198 [Phlebiopsis gigantea 11061_1 CR5-6]
MQDLPWLRETEDPGAGSPEKSFNIVIELNAHRRAALSEVDTARWSRYHFKIIVIASMGFFTDSYDIFAINIAATMLGYIYGKDHALSANQDLGLKVAAPIGSIIGQLLFGWLADVIGRKRMYGVELIIMILGTFGQAVAGEGHAINVLAVIILWRFIMGLGIGGDCPLSTVIPSEFAPTQHRGTMMAAVWAARAWGASASAVVALIITDAYKRALLHDDPTTLVHVDSMWRLLIGLGCVPAAVGLFYRLTMPETPRFTMDIERNVRQASEDVDTFLTQGKYFIDPDVAVKRVSAPRASKYDFKRYFSQWQNKKTLFGVCWSWFAIDLAFYGLGLNTPTILDTIGFGAPSSATTGTLAVHAHLHNLALGNLVLTLAGQLPGAYACVLAIDRVGRKPLQAGGFAVLAALLVAMGAAADALAASAAGTRAFVFLFCLATFAAAAGPRTTAAVVPGELFPTRYRATANGLAAACGALGAVVAQVGFARMKDIGGPNRFVQHILEIFAVFMLSGVASTMLLPETKGRSLEELSCEDQDEFIEGMARYRMRPIRLSE